MKSGGLWERGPLASAGAAHQCIRRSGRILTNGRENFTGNFLGNAAHGLLHWRVISRIFSRQEK
jgi:hypothetical protein